MKVVIFLALLVGAVCGNVLHKQLSFPTGRVVGGSDAKPQSAPYIVSLQFFGSHFCGGALIDENTILTAAHCLTAMPCVLVSAVGGLHNLRDTKGSQKKSAKKCIVHEKYGGGVGPYDIGLIILNSPMDLSGDKVKALDLPESGFIHSGDVTLYGWGSTSNTNRPSMPNILQTVTKPIVPYDKCEAALGGPGESPLDPSNVCTGPLSGGISACSGDSGGPLVQEVNGKVESVGVVSWGYIPCGSENAPSVYTRTSAYVDWIQSKRLEAFLMQ